MIPVGGRTSYAGDVLAIVVAETRAAGPGRGRARRRRRTTCCRRSPIRWPPSSRRRRRRRLGHRRQRAVAQRVRPRRRRRRARRAAPTRSTRCSRPSASSTPSSSRSRRSPCRPATGDDRTLHVYSGGQGVWDDRDDIAACSALDTDRVTVELVSNGGAFGGKEDMSNQAHAALAAWLLDRPVKCTLSREESFRMHAKRHPIRLEYWAGCDADGRAHRASRCAAIGDSGAYASRRDEGARAGRRARHRAVPRAGASTSRPIAARTNNLVCGAFRGLRRQPGAVRDGRRARPARRAGRHQRLGDPQAQRDPARRRVGSRPDHGRRCRRRRGVPRRDQAGVRRGDRRRQGGRPRPRAEELRARQRLPRGVRAPSCASRRRRRPRSRCATAGPRWARACTPSPCRSPPQELGIDPERIDVIVDTTRQLGFGQTTGSRGTLMAAGAVQRGVRGGARRRLPARTSTTTASTSSTGRRSSATRTTRHPTIHAAFGYAAQMVDHRPRHRARSSGSSPCTTSARRSTRSCARARSRAACTWASATR